MTSTGPVTHHPEFYFQDGTYILRVENTLYKLYHGILVAKSKIFVDLFDIGSHEQTAEGTIDEDPIVLPNLMVKAFDLFVEYKFGW